MPEPTNGPDHTAVDQEWKLRRSVEDAHSRFNRNPTVLNAAKLTATVQAWRENEVPAGSAMGVL